MNIKNTCATLILVFALHLALAEPPLPKKIKKILFLGNSITYAGGYITDIETYFVLHYPKQNIEFINVGLPSETVSGLSEPGHAGGKYPRPDLHERLARVLALTKPDLVFACYGMNDGIYMPFDTGRFEKYKDGIVWLHQQVVSSGARVIHVTPPLFDEVKGGHKGYSAVLDTYSNWLLRCRDSLKWEVADVHFPMKTYLQERRLSDSSFFYAKDGIHPDSVGHFIIAKQLLLYLGIKKIAEAKNISDLYRDKLNGEQVNKVITERQAIMKDAWLTTAGHQRPGMKTGLPLDEAKNLYRQIEQQLENLK